VSRSGYSEDMDDQWALIRWRGAVNSAIRGKRGQSFLRELLAALDAMPQKALIADELATADGEFCALGVVGAARGIDMEKIDPHDPESVAPAFGIAEALAREIVYHNDEACDDWMWCDIEIAGPMRPWLYERHRVSRSMPDPNAAEKRWRHMRAWVAEQIAKESERQSQKT
jgi:hypothetical protein